MRVIVPFSMLDQKDVSTALAYHENYLKDLRRQVDRELAKIQEMRAKLAD